LLCHRCGSPVPDNSASCATCGLKLAGGAAGAAPRRRTATVEAPYKPGDIFARRYAIREVLGPGPVGHVFRAQDQEMDVEVALKIINPRLVQMQEERTQFSLALRAGKKLTHPHHVRVYEEGEDRNRPFFTTQLLEGTTLRRKMEQRVAQGMRFTLKEVEGFLVQLVEALDNAHRYGPHSDLKPENIVLMPDLLKVTDYGLALGIPRLPYIQAQKAWKVGCYLAPEYFEGGELDTRMDLYALGVIMGELLTGQTPEEGEVPELLAYEAELPSGIEALYRRATNANPLARPKSAGEFLTDFTAALSSRPRPASARPAAQAAARARAKQQVPFSLTADLATAAPPRSHSLPPPVPTSEMPTLGSPTIQVPTVGDGPPPDEDDTKTAVDAPSRVTMETPASGATTLEIPQVAVTQEEALPPDATQKLDSEALAAIMETARPAAPSPPPKARPVPASRTDSRPPAKAAPPSSRAATRTDPLIPISSPLSRLWIPLLAVGGLALGAMAGYGLLKWRQASQAPSAPVADSRAAASPGDGPAAGMMGPTAECPRGMRRVSGGSFKKGKETVEEGTAAEPLIQSQQVATFCIDEFEFPNQPGAAPRVDVTWEEARAECGKLGKRLCSEDEWEKACKGPGSLRYPYGSAFDAKACNTQGNGGEPAASGSFGRCRSGYGIADLSGNVAEWTASSLGGADRVQKGGAFDRQQPSVRCAARMSGEPESRSSSVGFRCCKGET
jgi:serine/threonine protein kinase